MKSFFIEFMQLESRIFLAFIISQLICAYSIIIIVKVAKEKRLFSTTNERTVHTHNTPTIGGVAIFATILVVSLSTINSSGYSFIKGGAVMPSLPSVISGITILFLLGLKDDLLGVSWKKKLMGQVAAMLLLCIIGNERITNMQGLFGIYEITYEWSMVLTVFIGIVIINAFNLIDGIDGLASAIALIVSFTFGWSFFVSGEKEYVVLCSILIGSLIPFFYFNVWGRKNKLFMGDTGSLILGFLITALVIHFNKVFYVPNEVNNLPIAAISIGILIIPLFDTLRVFTIRVLHKESPFKADRSHIHHLLLSLGLSHLHTTIVIAAVNILFIIIAFSFSGSGMAMLLIIYAITAMILISIPLAIRKKRVQKEGQLQIKHHAA